MRPLTTLTYCEERLRSALSVTASRVAPLVIANEAPSTLVKVVPLSVPPFTRKLRLVSMRPTLAVPESVIVAADSVSPMMAVSAGPGSVSPAQFTGSRKLVPEPSRPPSQV